MHTGNLLRLSALISGQQGEAFRERALRAAGACSERLKDAAMAMPQMCASLFPLTQGQQAALFALCVQLLSENEHVRVALCCFASAVSFRFFGSHERHRSDISLVCQTMRAMQHTAANGLNAAKQQNQLACFCKSWRPIHGVLEPPAPNPVLVRECKHLYWHLLRGGPAQFASLSPTRLEPICTVM